MLFKYNDRRLKNKMNQAKTRVFEAGKIGLNSHAMLWGIAVQKTVVTHHKVGFVNSITEQNLV